MVYVWIGVTVTTRARVREEELVPNLRLGLETVPDRDMSHTHIWSYDYVSAESQVMVRNCANRRSGSVRLFRVRFRVRVVG